MQLNNNININLNQIVDDEGHNRFVEGNITTTELAGLTYDYAKWSLSGTHLMMVILGKIDDNVSIADGFNFGLIPNIPSWILDKIYPSYVASFIEFKEITARGLDSWTSKKYMMRLQKATSSLAINLNNTTVNDTGHRLGFRIQFDLLIDTD